MRVHKYILPMRDLTSITMPKGAKILSVKDQGGIPMVWALIDPAEDVCVQHEFRVAGTGHDIDPLHATCPFVGTLHLHGGALVFHIFDLGES